MIVLVTVGQCCGQQLGDCSVCVMGYLGHRAGGMALEGMAGMEQEGMAGMEQEGMVGMEHERMA